MTNFMGQFGSNVFVFYLLYFNPLYTKANNISSKKFTESLTNIVNVSDLKDKPK